ncbi:MAG: hypothetical protein ACYDHN_09135 [Solirubrobacteraceae bacterium]
MRARLLHPRGERRRPRRRGAQLVPQALPAGAQFLPRACDPAVERVREAGGPVDKASYSCQCGYLFSAAVSATVVCPHCGADQAW